jgi:hypothetical protein
MKQEGTGRAKGMLEYKIGIPKYVKKQEQGETITNCAKRFTNRLQKTDS